MLFCYSRTCLMRVTHVGMHVHGVYLHMLLGVQRITSCFKQDRPDIGEHVHVPMWPCM